MKLARGMLMAQSMVTATYKDSSFAGMSNNPHRCEEAISKILSTVEFGYSPHDPRWEVVQGSVRYH